MSSIDLTMRTQKLQEISTMIVNGYPTFKLDFLGTISIHGREYFNVFRRYNNVYEFVYEDYHGELHYHKDYTVFQSIQRLLCLTEEQMRGIRVLNVFSMKHNGTPVISDSFLDMRWSVVHANWQGLMMNLGGILDYHSVGSDEATCSTQHSESIEEDTVNDAIAEMNTRIDNHDEMIDRCRRIVRNIREDMQELRNEFETPNPKNTIHYPDAPEKALRTIPYRRNGLKRQRLTDRFAALETDKQESELSDDWEVEISGSEEDNEDEEEEDEDEEDEEDQEEDEDEEDEEDEEDQEEEEEEDEDEEEDEEEEEEEEDNYLELRSGMKYNKY